MPATQKLHSMIDASSIMLPEDAPLIQAMEVLEKTQAKIVLVVDAQKKLVGSVVDGDMRRAFLRGRTLQTPISEVMHKSPTVLPVTSSRQQILEAMHKLEVKQIPLISPDGTIAGIAVHDMLMGLVHQDRPNRVVIMAGGKGKRLMPITSDMPKPMVAVGGKPILEWILLRFTHYGFRNFTFAINYLGHMIEDYFGDGSRFGCHIEYVKEKEFLGTAGALSLLPAQEKNPLIVMNGDILSSIDFAGLVDFHDADNASATVCARSHRMEVPFGVIELQNGYLNSIVEKPVYDNLISAGIYVLSPDALKYIAPNTVTDMPGLLLSLVQDKKKVGVFSLQEDWVDIGRHDDLERAKRNFTG